MALLQDLPSEVLLKIAEIFAREWRSHSAVCDMLSLSLVSQLWSKMVFERLVSQFGYPTSYSHGKMRDYIVKEMEYIWDQPMTRSESSKKVHCRVHCRDLFIRNWDDYVRLSMDAGLPQRYISWSAADLYLRKNVQAQRFILPTGIFPLSDASGTLMYYCNQNCVGMESPSVIHGREVASTHADDLMSLKGKVWHDNWRKAAIAQKNYSALEFDAHLRSSLNGSN